jgi:hypothetical protein
MEELEDTSKHTAVWHKSVTQQCVSTNWINLTSYCLLTLIPIKRVQKQFSGLPDTQKPCHRHQYARGHL